MSQILFVCTGNTCRSPMAEAVMKVLLRARGLAADGEAEGGIAVLSAGLSAFDGAAASRQAMEAVEPVGGDLRGFRSRRLTGELVDASDLVVVMTAGHRRQLLGLYPRAEKKTKLLLEFAPRGDGDVADPYGGSLDLYKFTLEGMLPALEKMAELAAGNRLFA